MHYELIKTTVTSDSGRIITSKDEMKLGLINSIPGKQRLIMEGGDYILQVDDEEICHFITQRVLKFIQTDLPVYCAYNGQQALELIESKYQHQQLPTIMFVDIHMPGMSGFEFLEHLKLLPIPSELIKIVVLSSSHNIQDINKAKQLGADHYISKPLSPDKANSFF